MYEFLAKLRSHWQASVVESRTPVVYGELIESIDARGAGATSEAFSFYEEKPRKLVTKMSVHPRLSLSKEKLRKLAKESFFENENNKRY